MNDFSSQGTQSSLKPYLPCTLYYLCDPCAYGKSLTAAATPPVAATFPVVATPSIAATPPPTARVPVDATPQVGSTPLATVIPSYANTSNMPTNDGYWYNYNEGGGVPNDGNDGHTHSSPSN